VLQSAFSEGAAAADPSQSKAIMSHEDFGTLHTLFHFIYTQNVFFTTDDGMKPPDGMPCYLSAEQIYAVADRIDLPVLKGYALDFLSYSCDTNNIIPRIFDEFTLLHDEIEDKYKSFFLEKWNVIWEESKLDEYFEKIEKEDPARIPKILTRFCTLMKQIPQK
jgi:hypothetical protein